MKCKDCGSWYATTRHGINNLGNCHFLNIQREDETGDLYISEEVDIGALIEGAFPGCGNFEERKGPFGLDNWGITFCDKSHVLDCADRGWQELLIQWLNGIWEELDILPYKEPEPKECENCGLVICPFPPPVCPDWRAK